MDIVTLTETAANQIKHIMKENGEEEAYLRIGVEGGGCGGLSYAIGFSHELEEEDTLFEQFGIKIVVDDYSLPALKGSKIDYIESVMGGGFAIDNPNAVSTCGCGSSFRTAENSGTPESC